jgi:hypothetical protein
MKEQIPYEIHFIPHWKEEIIASLSVELFIPEQGKFIYNVDWNTTEENINANGICIGTYPEKIFDIYFDDLNDKPIIDVLISQSTSEGLGKEHKSNHKLKASNLLKKSLIRAIDGKEVYRITGTALSEDSASSDSIGWSIKRNETESYNPVEIHHPEQRTQFEPELDLHIEKLISNPGAMATRDIIHLQIKRFEDYLEQAVRLGIPSVFIIHGVGRGRLREEIAKRLSVHPYVKEFKNEFHPLYGFGATEVLFD